MNHKVFISYAHEDASTAVAICRSLEEMGVPCWIAPRNLEGGTTFGDAIERAILTARIFIILFSRHATESRWVKGELNIAFNEKKVIIPFRIDDTAPDGEMRLMLANSHWLDHSHRSLSSLVALRQSVTHLLGVSAPSPPDKKHASRSTYGVMLAVISTVAGLVSFWSMWPAIETLASTLFVPEKKEPTTLLQTQLSAREKYQRGLNYFYGIGLRKDLKKGCALFEEAAEMGDEYALWKLGRCYQKGEGVGKDLILAVEYFKKAAALNNADAQNSLGSCYYKGLGVPRNYKKAVELFEQSAKRNNSYGLMNLAGCLYEGRGIEKDVAKAIQLLDSAIELGNEEAPFLKRRIYAEAEYRQLDTGKPSGVKPLPA